MMTIVVQGRLNWFYRNFLFEELNVFSNISSGPAADNARYWKDCQPLQGGGWRGRGEETGENAN